MKTSVRALALPAVLVGFAGSALAAVPADVTTALETLKTDGIAMATVVLVAIIAIFAIKFLRKGI